MSNVLETAPQAVMEKAVRLLPERLLPGGEPDPLAAVQKGWLGQAVSRVDGPQKVRGEARFAAEVPFEGLTYAALTYSTVARGRIATLDTTAAETAPGVVFVMTYRNAPRLAAPKPIMTAPQAAGSSDLPVMQDAEIHWNGQPIALVLATTQEAADHATSLIRATYELLPAHIAFDAEKTLAPLPENVLGAPARIEVGDAEAALAGAAVRVDHVYRTPRQNHNAIELHAATVNWEGDQLTVHDATQMLVNTRWTLAEIFGVKEDKIRVLSPFVGGGFGGKGLWNHQILAIAAAKASGRPVRIVLSREGVFRAVGGRATTEQRVALGANADASLAALIHTGVTGTTAHNNVPEQFTFPARHLYAAETLLIEQRVARLDIVSNTFMRAPGESVGTFALESALDELAAELQVDPIELRRRIEPEKDPTSGAAFSSRNLVEAYRRGAERFGWARRNPVPGSQRDGEWLIGMGVATATYPYYRRAGSVRIRLGADGRAVVQMASQEMGMGTATIQAQHAAERLGLPLDCVRFEYGDSDLPPAAVAGGSSQTASNAAAIIAGCEALVTALLKLVGRDSPLAGLDADAVEAHAAGLRSRADPTRHASYAAILAHADRVELVVDADAAQPLEATKYSMHSYGAQFCELRVSAVTGEVRVTRFLGSFDAGRILNPKTAASQFRGGIVMGLGLALTEDTLFDERSGRIMNPSLAEYHVPVQLDVPDIDVVWTDLPDPHSPLGAHGIGEIGITGVGAAVANAIYNATGKRVRSLPITLDKLL